MEEKTKMAKRTRGARIVQAKRRASKTPKGKGRVRSRPVGKRIMKT